MVSNKKTKPSSGRKPIIPKKTAKERLQGFWDVFSREDDVLVVINADPDALASAMAVKRLLRYRVKQVVICYPNEIRRLSNVAMVERLKIQAERLQNVKPKDFSKKVIVDSETKGLKTCWSCGNQYYPSGNCPFCGAFRKRKWQRR